MVISDAAISSSSEHLIIAIGILISSPATAIQRVLQFERHHVFISILSPLCCNSTYFSCHFKFNFQPVLGTAGALSAPGSVAIKSATCSWVVRFPCRSSHLISRNDKVIGNANGIAEARCLRCCVRAKWRENLESNKLIEYLSFLFLYLRLKVKQLWQNLV